MLGRIAYTESTLPARQRFANLHGRIRRHGLSDSHAGGLAARRLLQGMGYGDPSIAALLDVAADLVNHFRCWRLSVGPPDQTAAMLAQYAREQAK